ncbi:SEC-C domain-containing protein [Desulfobulbus sp. F1]|nr:SEC-C domain-containing protein [Desulfobulbus sp. F1]
MIKISRNQPCPCRSGRKYKHCCLSLRQAGLPTAPVRQTQVSLLVEIEKIQQAAMRCRKPAMSWECSFFSAPKTAMLGC